MIAINNGKVNGMKVNGNSKEGFRVNCNKCGYEFKTADFNEINKCPKCKGKE